MEDDDYGPDPEHCDCCGRELSAEEAEKFECGPVSTGPVLVVCDRCR